MAGNHEGGLKAAQTNKAKHGANFYAKIGARGGANGTTGGFYYSKHHGLGTHIEAGRKGGEISRRTGITTGATRITVRVVPKPRPTLLKKLKEMFS